jgi:hypothetical protein
MKKIYFVLAIVTLSFFSNQVLAQTKPTKEVCSLSVTDFKPLNIPSSVKSNVTFAVGKKGLTKKMYKKAEGTLLVYFDVTGKISYAGYSETSPGSLGSNFSTYCPAGFINCCTSTGKYFDCWEKHMAGDKWEQETCK